MTTILTAFLVSLFLSAILTPLARRFGLRFGVLDLPDARKIHSLPIPRSGGLAIFTSFFAVLALCPYFSTDFSKLLSLNRQFGFFILGAVLIFGVGLWDDFKRLSPGTKILVQVIGASLAYFGGLQITKLSFLDLHFQLEWASYFVTVFWFALFINAINLVDGLDGLAAGLVCFASLVMVTLGLLKENYLTALLFAILAGSVMGFLRYNFNPASIFLGDGGSYLLGYLVAGLSIMTSVKSNLGAAIAIPLLALGVPVFDTILSPVRRFLRGQKLFFPDKGHVHHRLLAMGMTTRKAVGLIYAITAGLCFFAIFMVHLRDEQSGLFLIILAAAVLFFIRKLGYLDYVASDKVMGWFLDVTDAVGVSRERRSFLNIQIEISQAKNFEQMWFHTTRALEMLNFDRCDLSMNGSQWLEGLPKDGVLQWERSNDHGNASKCPMRIELPLVGSNRRWYGNILLEKDLKDSEIGHYTLKRVEHLRRNVIHAMERLDPNLSKSDRAQLPA